MAAARFWTCLTTTLTLQVFGEIQKPTNIRIHAFNLKYLLKWDDVQRNNYSVSYTVQYKSPIGSWRDVKGCESISHTVCDFTSTDIDFMGHYMLRLQARQGNQTSAWLNSTDFIPYKHSEIGPPSISVNSKDNFLNVYILDPQTENNESIPKTYKAIKYRITYWKESSHEIRDVKESTGELVSLKLEPWTTYCLHVQAFSDVFSISGQLSRVVCEKTKGTAPLWQVLVTFLISLVIVFGVAVGCCFFIYYTYRCIKYTCFPPHILPEHLQEYFSEPPQNAFLELAPEEDDEECCDQLKVIFETESLNSCSSTLTLPNTENEKNDQSCQTSADSGQFSNEGSSKSDGTEELDGRALRELDLHTKTMYFCD